jgi:hypothetical protein
VLSGSFPAVFFVVLYLAEGVVVQLQNLIDVGVLFKRGPWNLDALF